MIIVSEINITVSNLLSFFFVKYMLVIKETIRLHIIPKTYITSAKPFPKTILPVKLRMVIIIMIRNKNQLYFNLKDIFLIGYND